MLFCTRYGPSRVFTSRSASPRSRATSNIDVAFQSVRRRVERARALLEDVDRVLRDRQVARRQHDDHAVARPDERRASSRSGRSGRRRRWCGSPRRRSSRHRATSRRSRSWRIGRAKEAWILPEGPAHRPSRINRPGPGNARLISSPSVEMRCQEIHQVLVQAEADDVVGACRSGGCACSSPAARSSSRRSLVAEALERLVDEVHAAVQRARHVVAQDQELGDAPRRDDVAVDLAVGLEARHRAQQRAHW